MTMDEHARKTREQLIASPRRRELDKRVEDLDRDLSEIELRYVRDKISAKLSRTRA
jgi:hypothetical protein